MDSLPPMKQLYLELTEYRNKYRIHLGNGSWLTFENKTQAAKFLRKYKRIIRDNVNMLNLLQPNVNQLYRQTYFQLSERDINHYKRLFHGFDDRFTFIFKKFSSGNRNAFVFQNIQTCFNILIEIVESLHVFGQKSKNYNLTTNTRPLLKHLEALNDTLSNDKRNLFMNDKNVIELKNYRNESTTTKQSVGN